VADAPDGPRAIVHAPARLIPTCNSRTPTDGFPCAINCIPHTRFHARFLRLTTCCSLSDSCAMSKRVFTCSPNEFSHAIPVHQHITSPQLFHRVFLVKHVLYLHVDLSQLSAQKIANSVLTLPPRRLMLA